MAVPFGPQLYLCRGSLYSNIWSGRNITIPDCLHLKVIILSQIFADSTPSAMTLSGTRTPSGSTMIEDLVQSMFARYQQHFYSEYKDTTKASFVVKCGIAVPIAGSKDFNVLFARRGPTKHLTRSNRIFLDLSQVPNKYRRHIKWNWIQIWWHRWLGGSTLVSEW